MVFAKMSAVQLLRIVNWWIYTIAVLILLYCVESNQMTLRLIQHDRTQWEHRCHVTRQLLTGGWRNGTQQQQPNLQMTNVNVSVILM